MLAEGREVVAEQVSRSQIAGWGPSSLFQLSMIRLGVLLCRKLCIGRASTNDGERDPHN